jgi:hypothetical protein
MMSSCNFLYKWLPTLFLWIEISENIIGEILSLQLDITSIFMLPFRSCLPSNGFGNPVVWWEWNVLPGCY